MKAGKISRTVSVLLLAGILAMGTACGEKKTEQPAEPEENLLTPAPTQEPTATPTPTPTPSPTVTLTPAPTEEPSVGIPNPWSETENAAEAAKGSGIEITLPVEEALPGEGDSAMRFELYRWMEKTIEAVYRSDNDDDMRIRVSLDLQGEELTGDYNEYKKSWDENYKGLEVHCKGDGKTINCAYFDAGGLHYAVDYDSGDEGNGLTPDELGSLLMSLQAAPYTEPTPTPTPGPNAPKILADPTDEAVNIGEGCMYIATADTWDSLAWHFVSPDGKTDLSYEEIGTLFPDLGLEGPDTEYLTIYNIPAEFNGWRSYCRFTNSDGSTDSAQAVTTVWLPESAEPTPTPIAPNAVTTVVPVGDDFYSGTFVEQTAQRGTMSIENYGDMWYVTVTWAESASDTAEWNFSGVFNGRGVMEYDDCVKTVASYDEDGNEFVEQVYTGGTGYIQRDDYGVTWFDDQENIADGTRFVQ